MPIKIPHALLAGWLAFSPAARPIFAASVGKPIASKPSIAPANLSSFGAPSAPLTASPGSRAPLALALQGNPNLPTSQNTINPPATEIGTIETPPEPVSDAENPHPDATHHWILEYEEGRWQALQEPLSRRAQRQPSLERLLATAYENARTLTKGDMTIRASAFSPDGQRLLTGSLSGMLKLWDLTTGELVHPLEGPLVSVCSLAVSPDGRKALSGYENGTLEFWDLVTHALIHTLPGHFGRVSSIAFSADGGKALSGSSDGTVKLWNMARRALLHTFRTEDRRPVHSVAFSSTGGILSLDRDGRSRTWEMQPAKKKPARITLSKLTQIVMRSPNALARRGVPIIRDAIAHSPLLKDALWKLLMPDILSPGKKSLLRFIPGSVSWFDDEEQNIRRRMPTLHQILSDPNRLDCFYQALFQLRWIYPYNMAQNSDKAPLAWASETGIEFPLNELRIVPVSEGFRRVIPYVQDAQGMLAVEIKIPGEDAGRETINPEHWTMAKELYEQDPEDPGVVKPIFFGSLKGTQWVYGKKIRFDEKRPLNVVIYKYEDGKRYRHAGPLMEAIAREKGIMLGEVVRPILADLAKAAIRFHRLGWGQAPGDGFDLHDENTRVLTTMRGVLVADFGAFARTYPDMKQRSQETLSLLGLANDINPWAMDMRRTIYPLIVPRLTKGIDDPAQRIKIEEEVSQELNLTPPP